MAQEKEELIRTGPRGSPPRRKRPAALPIWGESSAVMALYHSGVLADIAITLGILGFFYGLTQVSQEWAGILRPTVVIDLSLGSLPRYTFFSLIRGLTAYGVSLGFTIVYGYWAAKDKLAEKLLVPILDILQSIPVLGFMPGLVLALVSLFPSSNVGLELACILMIFTGQVWNMTFSFYNSLKSVPQYLQEAGTVYHFNWWQRLTQIEMPYSAVGLIWNSMMSMAGGWFFLMVTETFQLGNRDFRLPGIGSYMSVAVDSGNTKAMIGAVVAMILMIVALDQLLWRPIVVWPRNSALKTQPRKKSWSPGFWICSGILTFCGGLVPSAHPFAGSCTGLRCSHSRYRQRQIPMAPPLLTSRHTPRIGDCRNPGFTSCVRLAGGRSGSCAGSGRTPAGICLCRRMGSPASRSPR